MLVETFGGHRLNRRLETGYPQAFHNRPFFNIYCRDGKVTWLDLQDGLRKVVESARSDVSYKEREMPEWLVANRKVPFRYLVCSRLIPWSVFIRR